MKITYVKSIKSLKQDASFSIPSDDLDNIIWHDNNTTNITKQQILDEQTRLQDIEDVKPEHIAEVAKENDKANGNQKLLDLGLTQAEATALTGYTPPVAE